MEMIIHLDSDIFDIVKNERKNVEIRLNDEKKTKIKCRRYFNIFKKT